MVVSVKADTYFKSENINFIVILTDVFGNSIEGANCTGYIYDKSFNVVEVLPLLYSQGIYYANFTTPNKTGTYLEKAVCNFKLFGREKTLTSYSYFYVTDVLNEFQKKIDELVSNATLNITLNITGNVSQAIGNMSAGIYEDLEDLTNLMIALHSTPETSSVCMNESYRQIYKTATWEINNKTYNITKTELEYCPYGCVEDTGQCRAPSYMQIAIVIALLFVAGLVYFIIRVR
jgi:hypothetical protein